MAFGNIEGSLRVALFHELFWLDLIAVGTFVPPSALATTLASLSLMHCFGLVSPMAACVVSALTAPLALVFAKLDIFQRGYENSVYLKYRERRTREHLAVAPGPLIGRAMAHLAALHGATFCLALAGLIALGNVLLPLLWPLIEARQFSWGQLWILGSLGAILSLRYRPAYVVVACGALLAAAWYLS